MLTEELCFIRRSAHNLGMGVPLEDYGGGGFTLFEELSNSGWKFLPPASDIHIEVMKPVLGIPTKFLLPD